jgi:hypothetical protein
MIKERITRLFFPKSIKSESRQFLQLVGIDSKDNRNVILLSVASPFDTPLTDLKNFALNFYAEHGQQKPFDIIKYPSTD